MWFNSLLRSCVTAEGWKDSDEEKNPQTLAIIMPTQNSHVMTMFEHFYSYVEHLAPIVDGDDTGNKYVKSLKNSKTPPKVIFQLQDGWSVENLIAWIVSPSNSDEWNIFKQILDFDKEDRPYRIRDGYFSTMKFMYFLKLNN